MSMHAPIGKLIAAFIILLLLAAAPGTVARAAGTSADTLLFLVPDSADPSDPRITVWLDAAREEGLHVQPITDSQFLQLGAQSTQYLGLIMPDQVHVNAGDELVAALQQYVSAGRSLMLVYDAGALTADGFYAIPKSRFSALAGVDYVLYDQLGGSMIGFGNVTAVQSTWRTLRVPPGKSMLYPTASATTDPVQGMTSYYYGFLNYPSFVTQGTFAGSAFITSPDFGLVAGINPYGQGQVLFVNTPLGYLKGYGTDGLLLHGFLHYFGANMLQLPYLSPLPSGTAGMVLNVHTDCGNSLADIQTLDKQKIWNSGPYSIDFTAGPDCVDWGDNLGLNVPGNQTTQNWIKYFLSKGHEVGSHGGWIHDYFGLNVTEDNASTVIPGTSYTFNDLLVLNKSAMEAVMSPKKVREYAAPEGNTPKWSVAWLEQNGVVGYYWVGNTGMAPTRGYREGQLFTKKIWAHPITPYGTAATFEEFAANNIASSEASAWLTGLVDFAVQKRTSRMIYFHEPGVTGSDTDVSYLNALKSMLQQGSRYGKSRFQWYTMTALSDFMSSRELSDWSVSVRPDGSLGISAAATPPSASLKQITWALPKSRYAQPVAITNVKVIDDKNANEWLVVCGAAATAQFTVMPSRPLF